MIQIDMQMPENCADCCFATADLVNGTITLSCMTQAGRRMYAPDLISRKDRPEWCPLKGQEAVKPRISTVEQRCGNCNKVIEMDGWITCPWCGKPILWEAVGRKVK